MELHTIFLLTKLEHYLEARWWNKVFEFAQEYLECQMELLKRQF
jgi:malate synthase